MQDKERLDMLKGIAGTKVYEERRMESITTMQQNGKSLIFILKKKSDATRLDILRIVFFYLRVRHQACQDWRRVDVY